MTMNFTNGKKLLLETSDILENLNIPFFLIQGTALGAYRDRGFTPTEADIDLGILQENLTVRVLPLITTLINSDYQIETFSLPFHQVRTIVAWKYGIHVDIVGQMTWKDLRFTCSPVHPTVPEPYAIVHEAKLLEEYQPTILFNRSFQIPRDIEIYLEREYGKDWKTQKLDHISQTRVYNFVEKEGIKDDFLNA